MPSRKPRVPSYRLHRATGQAVVTIGGRDHYLGRHGTEASRRAYDALIGGWMAGGRVNAETGQGPDATVDEVARAFYRWAEGYYRKDGKPTSQVDIVRSSLASLHKLHGSTPAAEFGPSKLKALRQSWVDDGLSRIGANRKARVVIQAFTWAVEHEMVNGSVAHALKAVRPLALGRTGAREMPRVRPVADSDVAATLKNLGARDAAMVRLQLATGMRPNEACIVRPCDIDRSGAVWIYRPAKHKGEHRGKDRLVYLGPTAQSVLSPWLAEARSPDAYLFRGAKPGRAIGQRSYYRAITRACEKAGVPAWTPNQLRHNAGTRIRKEHGIETARIILGHSGLEVTQIYAEEDREKAVKVVEKTG